MTKLAAVLFQIDSGSILLPEFQRGYVWNRDQVRGLMRSLYRDYPIGSLLTWETQSDGASVRGEAAGTPALRVLILDGQQRITTIYLLLAIIREELCRFQLKAAAFFDLKAAAVSI